MHDDFEQLNTAQKAAVTAKLGNLLVLAGAGSGKTRVLVHRIIWLMREQQVSARQILAVTFTNKAAGEMRTRLNAAMPGGSYFWVGTFHGIAHKLLRLHYQLAKLPQNFQVIDSEDQSRLIRRLIKQLNIDEQEFEPKKIQGFINRQKDAGVRASRLLSPEGLYEQVASNVYRHYEQSCRETGLVDFAELLLASYELLAEEKDLLAHYQARFRHVLVDEFQDTNTIQYLWLKLLANNADSISVVGDDDQSIYGWRGAKVENIFQFPKDFPGQTIRLEQNYRSTNTILAAANALIDNNDKRLGKKLWTSGEAGEKVTLYRALNEEDEAHYLVRKIKQHQQNRSLKECAILYRSNAQSRVIEEALLREGIAYVIYGGLRFFERAEIKDALAYLRLAVCSQDDNAFDRVVNMPPRGVGDRSIEKIREYAKTSGLSLFEASQLLINETAQLTAKARTGLAGFVATILQLSKLALEISLTDVIKTSIEYSGLMTYYKKQKGEKAQSRADNLMELINATRDFIVEDNEQVAEQPGQALVEFLAYTSLEAGDKKLDNTEDAVQLMTLHSAKGLEFPTVFICGMEEGLFPHYLCKDNVKALEEERRLCYVGITRAMEKLYLSYAKCRRLFGREEFRQISRFITEIPKEFIEKDQAKIKVTSTLETMLGEEHDSDDPFGRGCIVRHPKFGQGKILDKEGEGDKTRVKVFFDDAGVKWLVLSYARLEVVDC